MIEKIVTSLEVSRKLKDLGIIQESCFYWVNVYDQNHKNYIWKVVDIDSMDFYDKDIYLVDREKEKISAFTSEEIQEMNNSLLTSRVEKQAEIMVYRLTNNERTEKERKKELKKLNQNLKKWREE
jgi:hypothetical protein